MEQRANWQAYRPQTIQQRSKIRWSPSLSKWPTTIVLSNWSKTTKTSYRLPKLIAIVINYQKAINHIQATYWISEMIKNQQLEHHQKHQTETQACSHKSQSSMLPRTSCAEIQFLSHHKSVEPGYMTNQRKMENQDWQMESKHAEKTTRIQRKTRNKSDISFKNWIKLQRMRKAKKYRSIGSNTSWTSPIKK